MSEKNDQQNIDQDLINFANDLAEEFINSNPSLDEIDSFADEINRPRPITSYYEDNKRAKEEKPKDSQIRWPREEVQFTANAKKSLRATKKAWYKNHVLVPKDVQQERMKICEGCYHFQKGVKFCSSCGCFLVPKTALSMTFCPMHLWGQWDPDDTEVSE